MKRILLAFCLVAGTLATTSTQTYAQAVTSANPTFSKVDYSSKVGELNALSLANNATDAKTKWDEVHKMILSAFGVTKFHIKDAVQANNETLKAHFYDVMKNQQLIYNAIIELKSDLIANRVALNQKLTEFSATVE